VKKLNLRPIADAIASLLRAIPEPLFIAFFCIFPLFISAIAHYYADFKAYSANPKLQPAVFSRSLGGTIAHGELYLYCFSLFGTLLWLCAIDRPNRPFRLRWLLLLPICAIGLVSVAIYAINPDYYTVAPPGFIELSIIFYAIYVVIHVILTNMLAPDLSETFARGARQIMDGMSPGAGQ
jgi:hypothetical protein